MMRSVRMPSPMMTSKARTQKYLGSVKSDTAVFIGARNESPLLWEGADIVANAYRIRFEK